MDCYRNMRDVKQAFLDFMDRVPFYGMVVVCNDDAPCCAAVPANSAAHRDLRHAARFRFSDQAGEVDLDPAERQPISHFHVTYGERDLGEFRLHVPGVHNVLNATAAIAVGIGLDIKLTTSAPLSKTSAAWTAGSSCAARPPASA